MANYAMSIDLTTCVACDACVVVCKEENDVPDGFTRDWTEQQMSGTFPNLNMELFSNRCQHCSNAPCVSACPTKASHFKDGLVLIDRDICVECQHCIAACPYGARYHFAGRWVDKCTFCDHRIGTGKSTACVEICPTRSLVFGDLDDPQSEISELLKNRKYKLLKESEGTNPKYFILESTIVREKI